MSGDTLLTLAEALRAKPPEGGAPSQPLRLISHYSFTQFVVFLKACFARRGVALEVSESPYGTLMNELLAEEPGRTPALVIIDSDSACVGHSLRDNKPFDRFDGERGERQWERLLSALSTFLARSREPVYLWLLDLADPLLCELPGGVMSERDVAWHAFERRAYELIVGNGKGHLLSIRRPAIDQLRLFRTGEAICSQAASQAALDVTEALASLRRTEGEKTLPKKLLITDADGTLWHGIVGEDGASSLLFDESDAGSSHLIYQKFLHLLSKEGAILAIASKNTPGSIEGVFRERELLIPLERFSLVEASWEAKSKSVAAICAALNLLPSSAVFIDDNPAEIAEVRSALPEIEAIRFPGSSAELRPFLERLRSLFVRGRPAEEVERRLASYRAVVEARKAAGKAMEEGGGERYDDYLRSLKMVLTAAVVDQASRPRVFELLNKTNQFNLNGGRYGDSDFAEALERGLVLSFSLRDELADFGIIGVVVLRPSLERVVAESAVLSCRVFARGVEEAMLHSVYQLLREQSPSVRPLFLRVRPTGKNEPTLRFLRRVGILDPKADLGEVESLLLARDPGPSAFLGEIRLYSTATTA